VAFGSSSQVPPMVIMNNTINYIIVFIWLFASVGNKHFFRGTVLFLLIMIFLICLAFANKMGVTLYVKDLL
jgi:hypothetical protein